MNQRTPESTPKQAEYRLFSNGIVHDQCHAAAASEALAIFHERDEDKTIGQLLYRRLIIQKRCQDGWRYITRTVIDDKGVTDGN